MLEPRISHVWSGTGTFYHQESGVSLFLTCLSIRDDFWCTMVFGLKCWDQPRMFMGDSDCYNNKRHGYNTSTAINASWQHNSSDLLRLFPGNAPGLHQLHSGRRELFTLQYAQRMDVSQRWLWLWLHNTRYVDPNSKGPASLGWFLFGRVEPW